MFIILVLFIFLDLLGKRMNYLTLSNAGVIMYVEVKEERENTIIKITNIEEI